MFSFFCDYDYLPTWYFFQRIQGLSNGFHIFNAQPKLAECRLPFAANIHELAYFPHQQLLLKLSKGLRGIKMKSLEIIGTFCVSWRA